jgi:hypothetical protein
MSQISPHSWQHPELLLLPNTPEPLHGLVPRILLGKDWWDHTRRAAAVSTDFHCQACGVPKHLAELHRWLEGHEVYTIDYPAGRAVYVETVPLCHYCHNFIHSGRLEIMYAKGEITKSRFLSILAHGERVLAAAGLYKSLPYNGEVAPWASWRLILFGKEYEPIHKSPEDWYRFYNPA